MSKPKTPPRTYDKQKADKAFAKLTAWRDRGAWHFIFKFGVLWVGLPLGLFMPIAFSLMGEAGFFKVLAISLPICIGSGLVFGVTQWWVFRSLYEWVAHRKRMMDGQLEAREAAATDRYEQLAKLKQLMDEGAIEAADYERERQRLLAQG